MHSGAPSRFVDLIATLLLLPTPQAVAKADASAEERVEAVEARAAQRWEEREAKLLEGKQRAVEEAVAKQKAKVRVAALSPFPMSDTYTRRVVVLCAGFTGA